MALFNNVSRKISTMGQTTATKAQNVAESVKLTSSIENAKREMDHCFQTLGKELFAICLEKNTNMDNPTVQKLVALQNQIDQWNAQLAQLKASSTGGGVCSRCGAAVPAGSRFCSQCGGPVEEIKPVTLNHTVCPHCGAMIAEENKFCIRCGGALAQNTVSAETTIVPPVMPTPAEPETPAHVAGNTCQYCGGPVPEGNNFCPTCGQRVAGLEPETTPKYVPEEPVVASEAALFCSNCGAALEAGSRFCVECGAPVEV